MMPKLKLQLVVSSFMLLRGIFVLVILGIALLSIGNQSVSDTTAGLNPDSLWCSWEYESTFSFRAAKLDTIFQELRDRKRFSGAVLIAEKGQVLHSGAYGYADWRKKDTLSIHSSFQLASVSKVFTATAIMILYEDGLIDFDDPVKQHLPSFPYGNLTIRNLLNHRSGMGRYMAIAAKYWKKWRNPMDNDDVVYQYKRFKPTTFFRPNRTFNYCNTNYVFLASLVEEVSGLSFADFCQQRIFAPLGMKNSIIYSRKTDPEIPNEVIGYKAGWRGFYRAPNDYIDGVVGDKGMYSSVYDLFLFDQGLKEYRLLSKETQKQAYLPGSPRRRYNYGFGWRLNVNKTGSLPYHFGWWRGFRTCYIRDLEADRTIIILSNRDIPGRNLKFWDIYRYVSSLEWKKGLYD